MVSLKALTIIYTGVNLREKETLKMSYFQNLIVIVNSQWIDEDA